MRASVPQDQFKGPEEMVQEVKLAIPVNLSALEVREIDTLGSLASLDLLAEF